MKLYDELAEWWPLLSPPTEYKEEAELFTEIIFEHVEGPPKTLLELGAGAGNNAAHMKRHFRLTLTDISQQMLNVSRAVNPECEHIVGDMRRMRLGRTFDVVFVHDAISYATSERELRQSFETAFTHCAVGGVALFVPDATVETFEPSTHHGGSDEGAGSLRYLHWTFDPLPDDHQYTEMFLVAMRSSSGGMRFEHDEHTLGLFERAQWIDGLRSVGFHASRLHDSYGRDLFIGKKAAPSRRRSTPRSADARS